MIVKGGFYEYKENLYNVSAIGKMTHPVTGEWLDSVIYIRQGNTYTRELKDFEKKFVLRMPPKSSYDS